MSVDIALHNVVSVGVKARYLAPGLPGEIPLEALDITFRSEHGDEAVFTAYGRTVPRLLDMLHAAIDEAAA